MEGKFRKSDFFFFYFISSLSFVFGSQLLSPPFDLIFLSPPLSFLRCLVLSSLVFLGYFFLISLTFPCCVFFCSVLLDSVPPSVL